MDFVASDSPYDWSTHEKRHSPPPPNTIWTTWSEKTTSKSTSITKGQIKTREPKPATGTKASTPEERKATKPSSPTQRLIHPASPAEAPVLSTENVEGPILSCKNLNRTQFQQIKTDLSHALVKREAYLQEQKAEERQDVHVNSKIRRWVCIKLENGDLE